MGHRKLSAEVLYSTRTFHWVQVPTPSGIVTLVTKTWVGKMDIHVKDLDLLVSAEVIPTGLLECQCCSSVHPFIAVTEIHRFETSKDNGSLLLSELAIALQGKGGLLLTDQAWFPESSCASGVP